MSRDIRIAGPGEDITFCSSDRYTETAGEAPRAYVSTSRDIHPNEIHDYVNERVSVYKQLSGGIEFVSSIPRTASGKLLRRELVELYEKNTKNVES